jgi:hypothetical protein
VQGLQSGFTECKLRVTLAGLIRGLQQTQSPTRIKADGYTKIIRSRKYQNSPQENALFGGKTSSISNGTGRFHDWQKLDDSAGSIS